MSNLAIIRADEVVPGDVVCFDEPDFNMEVQQITRRRGYVGLFAANSDWRVYRKEDEPLMIQCRPMPKCTPLDDLVPDELVDRPFDWQDRLVIGASSACGLVCLAILIWGR